MYCLQRSESFPLMTVHFPYSLSPAPPSYCCCLGWRCWLIVSRQKLPLSFSICIPVLCSPWCVLGPGWVRGRKQPPCYLQLSLINIPFCPCFTCSLEGERPKWQIWRQKETRKRLEKERDWRREERWKKKD